jgi:hypothetical protein
MHDFGLKLRRIELNTKRSMKGFPTMKKANIVIALLVAVSAPLAYAYGPEFVAELKAENPEIFGKQQQAACQHEESKTAQMPKRG